ncbi:P-loop NTPase [Lachnotalea glycerini]|uniref:(4Fe-4S)-binding protein n=1 Tax=Lachnotalea glycerini TaxID=1763509 RepID=A0A371JJY4_9FIRM|nr:ATP-binding protein [Lachnotalea glycerini]RDY33036.1 (4Fe-4S)-binding protein [Lachnotalea glycerini]
MNIAILSGKGGTGKTTVSTNLAMTLGVSYVDCDVEEPNGFIFLNPSIQKSEDVFVEYPVINQEECELCGACSKVCRFHALAKAGKEIVVFEKLCHDCGACRIVCKLKALSYAKRSIGKVESGTSKEIQCFRGILNVGEPMAVPVIRKVLKELTSDDHLVDCPPGTSCNVVTALKYVDAAILVTEPSEFGLHDLKMAVELVKLYSIPYGIIINKDDGKDNMVKAFCRKNGIALLGTVPYSMEAAALYSKGIMLYQDEKHKKNFINIAQKIKEAFAW